MSADYDQRILKAFALLKRIAQLSVREKYREELEREWHPSQLPLDAVLAAMEYLECWGDDDLSD